MPAAAGGTRQTAKMNKTQIVLCSKKLKWRQLKDGSGGGVSAPTSSRVRRVDRPRQSAGPLYTVAVIFASNFIKIYITLKAISEYGPLPERAARRRQDAAYRALRINNVDRF